MSQRHFRNLRRLTILILRSRAGPRRGSWPRYQKDKTMLKGKTALITGSTSGIGQGIAEDFAAKGCNIVLNGFGDAAEIERLRAKLAADHQVAVRYDNADMSKGDAITAMMDKAIAEFGALDILVNNAGIQHVAPIDDFPIEKWEAVVAIDLMSSFYTILRALLAL